MIEYIDPLLAIVMLARLEIGSQYNQSTNNCSRSIYGNYEEDCLHRCGLFIPMAKLSPKMEAYCHSEHR